MKRTDFIDDDLIERDNDAVIGPAAPGDIADGESADDSDVPVRAISDFSLTRMARQKEREKSTVVTAMNEMERLRQRKETLEQEKRDAEELIRRQEDYEKGKREMIARLDEGVIALEKKEIRSSQLTELLATTRQRFKQALYDLDSINEEQWADDRFREELYRAMVIVDDARVEYNKALAKIEVLDGNADPILDRRSSDMIQSSQPGVTERKFSYWVRVGFAVTLPAIILATALMIVYLVLAGLRWI